MSLRPRSLCVEPSAARACSGVGSLDTDVQRTHSALQWLGARRQCAAWRATGCWISRLRRAQPCRGRNSASGCASRSWRPGPRVADQACTRSCGTERPKRQPGRAPRAPRAFSARQRRRKRAAGRAHFLDSLYPFTAFSNSSSASSCLFPNGFQPFSFFSALATSSSAFAAPSDIPAKNRAFSAGAASRARWPQR